MGVMLAKERRYLVAEDAEQVLSTTTGGAAGMDDILALLVGDLPFDKAPIESSEPVEPSARKVVFTGPAGTRVEAVIDNATATLRELSAFDDGGNLVLKAEYGEFEDVGGSLLPKLVDLTVPELDLSIGLRYKGWSTLDQAPDVFGIEAPEGMTEESLSAMITKMLSKSLKSKDADESGKKNSQ
jgi:hypothetical protein